jgi:hypothetical protein
MYYALDGYCNFLNETMKYKLVKSTGAKLDDWMIFNDISLTISGLVPAPVREYDIFKLIATDPQGVSISSNFRVYYLSKPYLNKDLPDFKIRTTEQFSFTIPRDTFLQPNGLSLTYFVTNYPSWMKLNSNSLTLAGIPSNLE